MVSIEIRKIDPLEGLSPDDKGRIEYLAKTSLPQQFQSRVDSSDLDLIRNHAARWESLTNKASGRGFALGLGVAFLWTVRSALRRRQFPPLFDRRAMDFKSSMGPFLKRWAEEESKINKGSWARFGVDVVIGVGRFAIRALPLGFIGGNVGVYSGRQRAQKLFDQDLDISGRRSAIFEAQFEAVSTTLQDYFETFGRGLDLPELRLETVRDEVNGVLRSQTVVVGPGSERRSTAGEGSEMYQPTAAQHEEIQKLIMRWQSLIEPQARLPALVKNIDNPPIDGSILMLDSRRDREGFSIRESRLEKEKRKKEFEALFEQEAKGGKMIWETRYSGRCISLYEEEQ